jgi:hypothetical protein
VADKEVVYRGGFSLGTVLFLIFLTLKLTGHIDWSWWWVTSPIWIPWAIAIPFFLVVALVVAADRDGRNGL